ncbi:MAG: hypothetical protein U0X39_01595 [Bacteroidales bacterium]
MSALVSNPWNSLEVVKICVALLTPILIFGVGLYINKSLILIEHNQWRNQKLIEKRIDVYDDLMPDLNDLLCYFAHMGNWKKFTPEYIVGLKRAIDRKVHLAAPLFADDFFAACTEFIGLCYETYTGGVNDAKLRISPDDWKTAFGDEWKLEWNVHFSEKSKFTNTEKIRDAYSLIVKIFAREMGLNPKTSYSVKK